MALQFTGERLEEIRTARGLSQSGLARRSGVAQATISLLEANRRNPGLAVADALARALGVTVQDLMTAPGSPIPPPAAPVPASEQPEAISTATAAA